MAKRVVTRVYRLRHAGSTSGWGYHMPSDGPMWFATRKAAQAYAAKMARTGGSFGRPFSTTIEPFGPSVGWASSNESRESNLRDAESALGVQFRRSGQPRRVGAKRKAGGKTSARKRVPSKRANPAMHLPPRPSDRASHVAWDSYMEKVDAMPVSFAGQPAYVRDLWNLTAMGFGKVSSDGTIVSFARKDHGDVWRKHPALKSKSIARIRLHEEGMVTPVRSAAKVSNPARKRIPRGR